MSFENIGKRETLPEKVSKTIKESILNGELKGGDALPTEPELEKQFGVSRAVIRDAVRMLKAQGLIEVKHGKGMYVSHSQLEAFTDALLTSLRRDNASAWDVEQFELIFMPQVFALASSEASDDEIALVKTRGEKYLKTFSQMTEAEKNGNPGVLDVKSRESKIDFDSFMISVFQCTHNKMVSLIGEVLISLRKWRTISDVEPGDEKIEKSEAYFINRFIEAIELRDSAAASKMISELLHYDKSMVDIMKNTPVGSSPEIPGETFWNAYKKLSD
jgi:DNA-binding FadR family transcriptional regulator